MGLAARADRGYPVSTAGLDATHRCIDLRQRALLMARKRWPLMRLPEQLADNLTEMLAHPGRGFTPFGWWMGNTGDGEITVCQLGGGWHRDSTSRSYVLRRGHVALIHRSRS
jgi:hypothetical protein